MPLPRITAITPKTTPAVAEKTYPDAFLSKLFINAPSPNSTWTADIRLRNYDYENGLIAPEKDEYMEAIHIANLQYEASRSPVVANALGAVLYAVSLLVNEQKTKNAYLALVASNAPQNEIDEAFQAWIDAQIDLGITIPTSSSSSGESSSSSSESSSSSSEPEASSSSESSSSSSGEGESSSSSSSE